MLIRELEKFTDGRRLLDVGAGLGESVGAALRRGWDAYGIESSARFADEANRRCPGRIFCGRIEEAPAEIVKSQYDAVVLVATLEHLHEPSRVLAAVSSLMKPGGVLFVDVPNESGIYFLLGNLWLKLRAKDWVVNLSPTFSPYHVFGFSKGSLGAILKKHGLEPSSWIFHPGEPLVPFRSSVVGLAEWVGSRMVRTVAGFGALGTYIECYARKVR